MSPFFRLKSVAAACFLAGLVSALSGCVNLEKKFPDIRTYSLDLSSQAHLAYEGKPASIRLNPFSIVPAFADRYLTYRTGETAYEQDFYNQWMTSPARLTEDQVFSWMESSPLVSFVLPRESQEKADYIIDGKLTDLSGDYRRVEEPKGVLKIQFTVSRHSQVLFQKVYPAEVPMERPSPKSLTEALNSGLGQVSAAFEKDFKSLLTEKGLSL